ncbi:MAG: DNA alkylation repair protein [Bacillota bacterium]
MKRTLALKRWTYREVLSALLSGEDKERGVFLLRFFKTGPGQYGEGDQFLGLAVPYVRELAKRFENADPPVITRLLESKYHEARLLGLLLIVRRYERAETEQEKRETVRFYLANRKGINNWDLVDLSVYKVWGDYLLHNPKEREKLYRYAASKNLWERRMAVVATMALIKEGQYAEIFRLAEMLLLEKEDLMHKAVGWMLRETGKKDAQALRSFLDRFAGRLPRTALRYAIERFPQDERLRYLSK